MSHFKILRVDHHDPATLGKKNRRLAVVYGLIPMLFVIIINIPDFLIIGDGLKYLISLPILFLFGFLLQRKIRKNNSMDTIGHVEITQSGLNKKIGDSITEYKFQSVKELTLTKHMPATRSEDTKSGYFSYILKIVFTDGNEESLIVADRSIDHNHKISVLDTIKTLKKLVPFEVKIDV